MADQAYLAYDFHPCEIPHRYGERVHLLADPVLLSELARLCRPETTQPEITRLVRTLYRDLLRRVLAVELPRVTAEVQTRMLAATPKGTWVGQVIDSRTRAVTVGIARAGTLPSQIAFETLTHLLDPAGVRQDHLYMNRTTDPAGTVTGVALSGSKIGGDVDGALVLFPDPMGATGVSMSRALDVYHGIDGEPSGLVCVNLIITPEYLARMHADHPEAQIYAVRLDRGMSAADVLATALGVRGTEEIGLNDKQYIVPGAGGLGEILNNSYV